MTARGRTAVRPRLRTTLLGAATALCLAVVWGCAKAPEGADETPPAGDALPAGGDAAVPSDTLAGPLTVRGAAPAPVITLQPGGQGDEVRLAGPVDVLEHLSGLWVQVRGRSRADGAFRVESFRVRRAEGVSAVDGLLTEADGELVLVEPDGTRHPVPETTPALRRLVGERVWIADLEAGRVESFGRIPDPSSGGG